MSDTGSKSKNPQEAAKADAKAAKAKRREVNTGTQVQVGEHAREEGYVPRFKKRYNEVIKAELMKKFGYTNAMQVPRVNKVVLNIGAGEAASDSKKIQQALKDAKIKVNAQIQDAQLRVSSKSKDELQSAMSLLRNGAAGWELDLQFKNFR